MRRIAIRWFADFRPNGCRAPRPRRWRAVALLACLSLGLSAPQLVTAQTSGTWTPTTGANNGLWNDVGNWIGGTLPTSGSATTLTFGATSGTSLLNQNLGAPFILNSLQIVRGTGANYWFTGNALQFQGTNANLTFAGTTSLTGVQTVTIGTDLYLGGNNFSLSSTGTNSNLLRVTGNIVSQFAGATTLTLGGTSTAANVVAGNILDNGTTGTISLVKSGSGTWYLGGDNTFSGNVTIAGGTLFFNTASNDGTSASALGTGSLIALGSGATSATLMFQGTSAQRLGRDLVLAGSTGDAMISNTSNSPSTTLLIDGNVNVAVGSKALHLQGPNTGLNTLASILTDGTGTLALWKQDAGTWKVSGNNAYTGGTTIGGGTLILGSATALGAGRVTVSTATLISDASRTMSNPFYFGGGTVTFSNDAGVTLTLDSPGQLSLTGNSTVTLANQGAANSVVVNDDLLVAQSMTFAGANAILLNGGLSFTGTTHVLTVSTPGGQQFNNITLAAGSTSGALTLVGTTTMTLNGTIADGATSGGRVTYNSGSYVVNGNNTYSGGTTINGGTITINDLHAFGSGAVTFATTSTLATNRAGTLANDFAFSGAFSVVTFRGPGQTLTIDGPGMTMQSAPVTLSGNVSSLIFADEYRLSSTSLTLFNTAFDFQGGISLTGPTTMTLTLNTPAQATVGGLNLSADGAPRTLTLSANTTTGLTVNGTISDGLSAGSGVAIPTGTVTFNGANTFSGLSTLTGGTLTFGHDQALGSATWTLVSGTLRGDANPHTLNNAFNLYGTTSIGGVAGLTLGGNITLSGGNRQLSFANPGTTQINGTIFLGEGSSPRTITLSGGPTSAVMLNGTITSGTGGTGGAVVYQTAPFFVNGTNAYGGGTTIGSGSVTVASLAAFGSGTLQVSGGSLVSNVSGALQNDVTINGNFTFTGPGQSLTFDGPGNVVLNLATGNTITNGLSLLTFNDEFRFNPSILAISGSGVTVFNGGLSVTGPSSAISLSAGGAVAGGVVINNGINLSVDGNPHTLSLRATNVGQLIVNGPITDGSGVGGIVITGPVILTGSSSFSGLSSISGGATLIVGNDRAMGNAILNVGGTIQADGSPRTLTNNINLVGTMVLSGSSSLTLGGNITVSGASRQISFSNTTAPTALTGTIFLGEGATPRTLTLVGNPNGTAILAASIVDGTGGIGGSVAYSSGGNLILSGTNTYSGTTAVNGGANLTVNNMAAFGSSVLAFNFSGTTSLTFGTSGTLANNISLSSSSIVFMGPGQSITFDGTGLNTIGAFSGTINSSLAALTFADETRLTTSVTLTGTGPILLQGGLSLSGTSVNTIFNNNAAGVTIGNIVLGADAITHTLQFNSSLSRTTTINGVVSDGNLPGGITINGSGMTVLGNTNTYSGGTTVSVGSVTFANPGAFGSGPIAVSSGTLVALASGTMNNNLTINGAATFTGPGTSLVIDGTGATTNVVGASTITTGLASITFADDFRFSGSGVTFTGPGLVTFNGGLSLIGTTSAMSLSAANSGGLTINGGVNLSADGLSHVLTLRAATTSGLYVVHGAIDDGLASSGVIIGTGNVTLNGTNSFTGLSTLNASTIQIGNDRALGNATWNVSGTLSSGSSPHTLTNDFNLLSTFSLTGAASLTLGGTITVTGGNRQLSFSNTNAPTTLNGTIVLGEGASPRMLTLAGTGATGILRATIADGLGGVPGSITYANGNYLVSGANTYSGVTTLNGATVTVGSAGAFGSSTVAFNTGTLVSAIDGTLSNNFQLSGVVTFSGAGRSLTIDGPGTTNLTSFLTFTNNLASLTFADEVRLFSSLTVTVGNLVQFAGGLSVTGTSQLVSVNNAGGTVIGNIQLSADGLAHTLTLNAWSSGVATVNGVISDGATGGSVVLGGNATIALNGTNTYGGGTTIDSGARVVVGNLGAFGSGPVSFTFTGSTTVAATVSGTLANNFNFAQSDVTFTGPGQSLTLGGPGVNLFSSGSLVNELASLTIANETWLSGTFTLSGSNAVNLAGGLSVTGPSTLNLVASNTSGVTIGNINLGLDAVAHTLTLNPIVGRTLTVSGVISDGVLPGSIVASGGTVVLSNTNTYSGGTTVGGGGRLVLNNLAALGSGPLVLLTATTLVSNVSGTLTNGLSLIGTVTLSGNADLVIDGPGRVMGTGGSTILLTNNLNSLTINDEVRLGNSLTVTAGNLVTLTGGVSLTGPTVVDLIVRSAGGVVIHDVNLSADGVSRTFTLNATAGRQITIDGVISDGLATSALSVTSGGVVVLDGTNTFSGTSTLGSNSTLVVGNNRALGNAAWNIVGSNPQLQADDSPRTLTNNFTLLAPLAISGTAPLTLGGTITLSGGDRQISVSNTLSTSVLSGTIILGEGNFAGRTLTLVGNPSSTLRIDGLIRNGSSTGALGGVVFGSGNFIVNGANTYTGGTTLSTGTVTIGSLAAFGGGGVTFTSGTLVAGTSGLLTNSFALNGNLTFTGANQSLTIDGSQSNTVAAVATLTNNLNALTFVDETRLAANLAVTSGNVVTFAGGISLTGGNRTLTSNNAGGIVVGNVLLSLDTTNHTLTLAGLGGGINITGTIADGVAGGRLAVVSGTVTLAGSNNFTGTSTLAGGTLVAAGNQALGNASWYVTNTAGVLRGDGTPRTLANGITLAGNLTIGGSSTLTLGNVYVDSTSRTLTLANSAVTTLSAVQFVDVAFSRTLTLAVAGPTRIVGGITDSGSAVGGVSVVLAGGNTLTLGGTSDYLSGTTISGAGTLVVDAGAALGNASTIAVLSGASLVVNGTTAALSPVTVQSGASLMGNGTIGGLVTMSGSLSPGNGVGTLSVRGLTLAGGSLNFELGGIGASDRLLITGSSAPAVSSTSSFNFTNLLGFGSGTYPLISGYAGLFSTTSFNLLQSPSLLAGYTLTLQNNSGELDLIVTAVTNTNLITWTGAVNNQWNTTTANWTGGATTFANGKTVTFDTTTSTTDVVVTGSSVVPANMNVLTDSLHNYRFSGGAIASSGALLKQGSGSLTFVNDAIFAGGATLAGGTLQIGEGSGTGSFSGNIADSGTVVFNRSNTLTYSDVISGTGGVAQLGPGTLVFTTTQTYSGVTTIAAGALQLGTTGRSVSLAGPIVNNGTLALFAASSTDSLSLVVSGTGNLLVTGTGTLRLTQSGGATGSTTIDRATLQAEIGVVSSTLVNQGIFRWTPAAAVTQTYAGTITGTGALWLDGANGGSFVLSSTNVYTGITTVNSAVLRADDGVGLPTASPLGLNNGLFATQGSFTRTLGNGAGGVFWTAGAGGGFSARGGPLTVDLGGAGQTLVYGQSSFLTGTSAVLQLNDANATNRLLFVNGLDLNGAALQLRVDDNTTTTNDYAELSGAIGNGSLMKYGSGLLVLSGQNTYTGATVVVDGDLQIGTGGTSGGILSTTIALAANDSLIFNRSDAYTQASAVSGSSANLVQRGTGTTTLAGNSTYGGFTSVAAGTLLVTGTLGNTTVTVASAATLGGGGRVGGSVAVLAGGSITGTLTIVGALRSNGVVRIGDGATAGLLTVGSLTLDGGSLTFGLGNLTNDRLALSGSLAPVINATVALNLTTLGSLTGGTYHLLNGYSGTIAAAYLLSAPSMLGGYAVQLQNNPGSLDLLLGVLSTSGTWVGNAGPDGRWSTAANWQGGQLPSFGDGAAISFAATSGTTTLTQDIPGVVVNSLTFDRSGGAFLLTGQAITFSGPNPLLQFAGSVGGSGTMTQTVAVPITLGGDGLAVTSIGANTNILRLTGPIAAASGNAAVLTLNGTTTSANTVAGIISDGTGTVAVVKDGPGQWILTAANTFSGDVSIRNGTLQTTDPAALGAGANLYLGSNGATGNLTYSSATSPVTLTQNIYLTGAGGNGVIARFGAGAATIDVNGNVSTLASGTHLLTISGGNASFNRLNGLLSDGVGTLGLVKAGSGNWEVTNTGNSFTGGIVINVGTLRADDSRALNLANNNVRFTAGGANSAHLETSGTLTGGVAASGAGNFTWAGNGGFSAHGGTLDVTLAGGATLTWGVGGFVSGSGRLQFNSLTADNVVTFNNNIDFAGGVRTLAVRNNLTTTSDYAVLTGVLSNGSFNKVEEGMLVLAGANTFGGTSTVSDGTIGIADDRALGDTQLTFVLSATGPGSIQSVGGSHTVTNNLRIFGALDVGGSNDLALGGTISGAGNVRFLNTAITTLFGDNTYTGATTIAGGTLRLGNGGTHGSIVGNVVDNGRLAFARSDTVAFSGTISGSGAVQIDSGTVIFSATNTYAGATTIDGGKLIVAGGTIGTLSSNVVVGSLTTGTLVVNGSGSVKAYDVGSGPFGGGSIVVSGTGAALIVQRNLQVSTLTVQNGATLSANNLSLGNAATANLAGTVDVGGLTSLSTNASLSVSSGTFRTGSLAGGGSLFDFADVVVGSDGTSTTFTGNLSGNGLFTKTGGGMLTLAGDDGLFTGGTVVAAGELDVNANHANSSTTVSAGAVLGGSGSVGSVTVVAGGILAGNLTTGFVVNQGLITPGGSGAVGMLTLGGLVIDGGTLHFDFSAVDHDQIRVTGTLPFVLSAAQFDLQDLGGLTSGSYTLLSGYAGQLSDTSLALLQVPTRLSGFDVSLSNLFGELDLIVTPITLNQLVWTGSSSNVWDASSSNWTGDGTTFTNGVSEVTFDASSAVQNVVVTGSGVQPRSLTVVTDTAQSYTFSGGAITSSGYFLQQGSGSVTFSNQASFAGPATIGGGTLIVADAFSVDGQALFVGGSTVAIGASGSLTVGSLAGSANVVDQGSLIVGGDDTSTTYSGNLSGSGRLTKIGAGTLVLSGAADLSGGVTIAAGKLQIGAGGATGSLAANVVNNGALVFSRSGNLAYGGTISGAGGVTINGGTITFTNNHTYRGGTTVAQGTLVVAGGSIGTLTSNLSIGTSTVAASLGTTNGGDVRAARFSLGSAVGTAGAATIAGAGSLLTLSENLYVGNAGTGTLAVQNQAVATAANVYLANAAGSRGTVVVSGSNSLLSATGGLYVAATGTAGLTVTGGGRISSTALYVGYAPGSTGTATIAGTGSSATQTSAHIGYQARGILNLQAGAAMASQQAFLGYTSVGNGTAVITGTGTTWSITGGLYIGNSGVGAVNVLTGGTVQSGSGILGTVAGGVGTATIDGNGSRWNLSAGLYAGYSSTGALNLRNAGLVNSAAGYVGFYTTSAGSVVVNGARWTVSNDLSVGHLGRGTLGISNGTVGSATAYLGYNGSAAGAATISGTAGRLTVSRDLNIGRGGSGSLSILAGGSVISATANLAALAGSTGTAVISGSGSQWTVTSGLFVGGNGTAAGGTGSLTLTAGGRLGVGKLTTLYAAATVTLGAGTTFTTGSLSGSGRIVNAGSLVVGGSGGTTTFAGTLSGSGSLTKLGTDVLILSSTNGYSGTTFITGGTLQVNGAIGTGSVVVAAGGTLAGSGRIGGAVTLSGGNLAPGTAATVGLLKLPSLILGGGTLLFNLSGTGYDQILLTTTNAPLVTASTGLQFSNLGGLTSGTYHLISGYTGKQITTSGFGLLRPNSLAGYTLTLANRAGMLDLIVQKLAAAPARGLAASATSTTHAASTSAGGVLTLAASSSVAGAAASSLTTATHVTTTALLGPTSVVAAKPAASLAVAGAVTLAAPLGPCSAAGSTVVIASGQTVSNIGNLTVNSGLFTVSGGGAIVGGGQTLVNGGLLSIHDPTSVATGTIVVNAGGTLHGKGYVDDVVINAGGSFSPGNSIGQLTIGGTDLSTAGSLSLTSGSNIIFEFKNAAGNIPGTDWDYVELGAGILNIDANNQSPANQIVVHIDSWRADNLGHGGGVLSGTNYNSFNDAAATGWGAGQQQQYFWKFIGLTDSSKIHQLDPHLGSISGRFRVIDDADGLGVFGPNNPYTRPSNQYGRGTFKIVEGSFGQGYGLYVTYSAIPEPGSMLFAGLASLAAGWYGRRRLRRRPTVPAEEPPAAMSALVVESPPSSEVRDV
jgi:fibronectin-binding autotransporter adhesin